MDSPSDWKIGWILSPIWILSIMGISEQPNVQVKNDETRKAGTYWDIWDKAETSGCQLKDRIFKWHRRQFRIATSTSSLIHIFSEVGFMPYRMLRTITYPYLTRQRSGWDLNQTVKMVRKPHGYVPWLACRRLVVAVYTISAVLWMSGTRRVKPSGSGSELSVFITPLLLSFLDLGNQHSRIQS